MSTSFSIKKRIVLLVGAAGGIGAPTAKHLASEGAFVILMDHEGSAEKLAALLKEIQTAGGEGEAFPCDITSDEKCAAVMKEILEAYEVDSLVFVAGFVNIKSVLTGQPQDLLDQVNVHACSVMRLSKPLIPLWLKAGRGDAIVLTSIAGELPAIDKHIYSASKAAATALVQGLAGSYGGRGLRFVPVLANRVGTPSAIERAEQSEAHMAEMMSTQLSKKWITPEEVAKTFHFLLSDGARPINGDPFYITDGSKATLAARPTPVTS